MQDTKNTTDVKLSENFSLREMTKSETATRLGIENTPSLKHIENMKDLAQNILQPVRNKFGAYRTTSGYRSPELCEAVGSNKYSNHAQGFAHDGEPLDPSIRNIDVVIWIAENLEFKELIAEYIEVGNNKAGWVHSAFEKGNNKGEIKIKDKNHDYTVVSLDYLKEYYGVNS